jgi:Cu/Ag efflux protein CusF
MQIQRILSIALSALVMTAALGRADEFRGRITKVDPAKKEVIVEGRGSARGVALGFVVNADTRIQLGREPAKLEDLQEGDRVRLLFENRNNERVALAITDSSLRPRPAPGGNAQPSNAPAGNAPSGNAPAGNPPAAPVTGPNTIAGKLIHVGLTEREIVIVSPGAQGAKETETTLLIPADVKITRDQKALKFDELKTGEQVTVQTQKRDGHLVAATIQSGGQPSAAAAMPPPPPENRRIEKIRQVLKIADRLLHQMDEQRGAPK